MDECREATFAKGRMVPGNLDDRFNLTFRAVHGSMIRAASGRLQRANFLARPLMARIPEALCLK
jgi:hypothetical protein